jgi:rhodanese-related sulfurtransferase
VFQFIKELGIIGMLTFCGAAFSLYSGLMPVPWKAPELAAGEIRLEDVQVLKVIWIDARGKTDYDSGHIPGAILLNEANWDNGINDLMNIWLVDPRPIVVYCSSEQCSASKDIARQLRNALPEAEVYSLKGGWEVWEQ